MADPARSPEGAVTVDEVTRGKALVRFTELPQALHGDDPRFAPPVLAWERYRLSFRRNPYFDRGDAALLLARRAGRPAGRIAAHRPGPGAEGRFGFWTTVDDVTVASALVAAARSWLDDQGCRSMTGPWSFEAADEPGVLAAGFEVAGTTGRPWRPPWEARLLEDLGFEVVAEAATWRLRTSEAGPDRPPVDGPPGQAGTYADPRLVLDGIAAVPDLARPARPAPTPTRGSSSMASPRCPTCPRRCARAGSARRGGWRGAHARARGRGARWCAARTSRRTPSPPS